MRIRNKGYYRVLHWPIWIWVFFLAPGPLVFSLFAHGFSVAVITRKHHETVALVVAQVGRQTLGKQGVEH